MDTDDCTVTAMPASFGQERLWFADGTDDAAHLAYLLIAGVEVVGALDVTACRRSVEHVAQLHEPLRTTFGLIDGELRQIVHARPPGPVVTIESIGDDANPHRESQRILDHERRTGFDLAHGPLLRVRIVRLGSNRHLLTFAVHHLVCDGWSLRILWRDIASAYRLFASGRTPLARNKSLQYADIALWQREQQVPQKKLDFWRRRLGHLQPLPLPAPRPGPRDEVSAVVATDHLDRHTAGRLRELAAASDATLQQVLLGATGLVAATLAGRDHAAVLLPVSGRDRPEMADLVGFFVNTVAALIDLRSSPTFRQLVAASRGEVLAAIANGDVPWNRVVHAIRAEDDPPGPMAAVMMLLRDPEVAAFTLPGLDCRPVTIGPAAAQLPVCVTWSETAGGLDLEVLCDGRVLAADVAAGIASGLVRTVRMMAHNPDRPAGAAIDPDLEMLTVRPRHDWAMGTAESTEPAVPADPDLVATIAEIWRQLLDHTGPIPDDAGFLALGGHSLLAVRMTSMVARRTGRAVRLRTILEHPTLAAFAAAVAAAGPIDAEPIPRVDRSTRRAVAT